MECPECQAENKEDALYCEECGAALKNTQQHWVRRALRAETTTRLWLGLVALVLFFVFGWAAGSASRKATIQGLENERGALAFDLESLRSTHENLKSEWEELLAARAEEEAAVPSFLPNTLQFNTGKVLWLEFKLGKGQVFNGRLTTDETLVFWVRDPWNRRPLDAGRVKGVYEFSFRAEMSGTYRMTFDDSFGHCNVVLEIDYGDEILRDDGVVYYLVPPEILRVVRLAGLFPVCAGGRFPVSAKSQAIRAACQRL